MTDLNLTLSDIGEKALIRDFIKPLFNAHDDPCGVGDDCAMVRVGDDIVLLSTDRVPADLTAFRLGILDYDGLGDYLARLNLSDIAACGGRPVALLLNLGLPGSAKYEDVRSLCRGFNRQAETHGCRVLGGDITAAVELSASATSIGLASQGRVLTRRGAKVGDSIFLSRPAGLTPTAFAYFLDPLAVDLSTDDVLQLRRQFTAMAPMIGLGRELASSSLCTSCMDNTDGIGQSLSELAAASDASFVVEMEMIAVPEVAARVANQTRKEPFRLLFDGGADFSLIGTLQGQWNACDARGRFGSFLEIIGRVERGSGVWLKRRGVASPLEFSGWNYFAASGQMNLAGNHSAATKDRER